MEYKEDKDFYRSLPKKELQELCKIYGLSPYMTKSKLVNSLCSYFKVNSGGDLMHMELESVVNEKEYVQTRLKSLRVEKDRGEIPILFCLSDSLYVQ